MGSGKTTIGRMVAQGLNRKFIDTDQYLLDNYGPPQKILQKTNGDAAFASIEEEIAQELSLHKQLVIATGGRFCVNPRNVAILVKSSVFLCLTAPLGELVTRLSAPKEDTYRPRFMAAENKYKLMCDLQQLSVPHFKDFEKISTSGKTAEEVADDLIDRFK